MKKNIYFLLFLVLGSVTTVFAQQPFGGCWHPKDIKDWSPEKDPEAKFNRSTVPLQPRFYDDGIKANPYQFYDGKITAALTMNPMCSTTPSQGADNFIGYNPSYWQYMDILLWWGGSAAEGNIIPPSAPVTDIAHLNGVRVLGNLFFAPGVYGGSPGPVNEMLTKASDGTFPYARKLYDIAKYYGFDGWFVNEETSHGNGDWKGFFDDFFAYAASQGDTNMELQWYLAGARSVQSSSIWNVIKDHKQASTFLDYHGTGNASGDMQFLQNNGYSREEAFRKAYYGVENAQNGLSGNGYEFKQVFPKEGHVGSLALFNPEEHAWKKVVENLLNTPDNKGQKAYAAMNRMYANEARFWTNVQHDPSDVTDRNSGEWPGLANAMQERSAIQTKPFVSSFSTGLGKHRFVNGEKKGTADWYHRGMQDILPTWRWWIQAVNASNQDSPTNKEDLVISYNWDDAYNVGTSLDIKGKLVADMNYITRLYKTNLPLVTGDKIELVYKTANEAAMSVRLTFKDDLTTSVPFSLSNFNKIDRNGWTVATMELPAQFNDKVLSIIALSFKSATELADFKVQIGQLAVLPANYAPTAPQVANMQFTNELKEAGESDIRVVWDAPTSDDVHHYNVYLERGGVKTLAGQTRNEGFYIPKFSRTAGETAVKVSVVTVTKDLKEGTVVELQHNYPALDKTPEVTVTASKTLIKPGDTVEFFADANREPTAYEWVLPEGAELVSGGDSNKAKIRFTAEGEFDITVKVSNVVGTTTELINSFIHVSSTKELSNVSENKKIHSESGHNGSEEPRWLIDGNTNPGSLNQKWCAGGRKDHWVVIDLESVYSLYKIKFFDCRVKEGFENVDNYKIEISQDAEEWTEVLNRKGQEHITVKDDYIKPTVGRYVRFTPYDEEKPLLIRIWEFQVFGTELSGTPSIAEQSAKNLKLGDILDEEFSYTLSGNVAAESDFNVNVASKDEAIATVSDVVVDKENSKVSYKLKAEAIGKTTVTIELTNGGVTTDAVYSLQVRDPMLVNVLKGLIPVIEQVNEADFYKYDNIYPMIENGGVAAITDEDENTVWYGVTRYKNDTFAYWNFTFDLEGEYEVSEFLLSYATVLSTQENLYATPPRSFTISGLNSEGNWVELGGESVPYNEEGEERNNIELANPIKLSKIKITHATPHLSPVVREFQAFGKKIVPAPTITQLGDISSKVGNTSEEEVSFSLEGVVRTDFSFDVSSSDDAVCKVETFSASDTEEKGKFTLKALKVGEATLTIKVVNSGHTTESTVKVTVEPFAVPTLTSTEDVLLKVNGSTSKEVSFSLNGSDKAADFDVEVVSKDTELCTVEALVIGDDKISFTVKALEKLGNTTVVVFVNNGSHLAKVEFKVTVDPFAAPILTPIEDISLKVGATSEKEVSFSLEGAARTDFSFNVSSSDNDVCKVETFSASDTEDKGTFSLKALKAGVATLTIKVVNDGQAVESMVKVTVEAVAVPTLTPIEDISLKVGATSEKEVSFSLEGAARTGFSFNVSSSNNEVCKVETFSASETEDKGTFSLKALKVGEATLTIKVVNDGQAVESTVKVKVEPFAVPRLTPIEKVVFKVNKTVEKEISFSLEGEEKQSDFAVELTPVDATLCQIEGIKISDNKINFTIKSFAKIGEINVRVKLINGGNLVQMTFRVLVEAESATSLQENKSAAYVVYPNPVKQGENIFVQTEGANLLVLTAFDGSVVLKQEIKESQVVINTANFNRGFYILTLDGDKKQHLKLIIR